MAEFNVGREIRHAVTDLPSAVEALRDHFRFARAGALPPWEQDRYETEWASAFVARVVTLVTDAAEESQVREGGEG